MPRPGRWCPASRIGRPTLLISPNPDALGLTPPNENGRQYKHGTLSGYGAGKCRCEQCRAACAIYRAQRRSQGKDNPRSSRIRQTDADGHISNDWFRRQVWYPAVKAAGLENGVRIHDLRHAHASWLLASGADLQVIKERLGHARISTTEKYLHTLPARQVRDLLAHTPHMVATLAQTIHLHRPRCTDFLSPTAVQPGTGVMVQHVNRTQLGAMIIYAHAARLRHGPWFPRAV